MRNPYHKAKAIVYCFVHLCSLSHKFRKERELRLFAFELRIRLIYGRMSDNYSKQWTKTKIAYLRLFRYAVCTLCRIAHKKFAETRIQKSRSITACKLRFFVFVSRYTANNAEKKQMSLNA